MSSSLYDYWIAIYSRKNIILMAGLVSFIFAWGISAVLPPVYEAKAAFYVPISMSSSQSQAGDKPTPQGPLLPVAEEKLSGVNVGIIKSKDIARRVQKLFPDKPLDYFKKNVDFVVGKGFSVDVYVRDRDPKVAAAIANAFPQAYDEFQVLALAQRDAGAEIAIRKQLEEVQQQLDNVERKLDLYKGKHTILPESQQIDLIKEFKENLGITQAEIAATRERIRDIDQQLKVESKNYQSEELVIDTPQINELKASVTSLEIDLSKSIQDLRPDHPHIKEVRSQLDATREALRNEVSRIINSHSKPTGSLYETLRRELIEQVNQLKYYEAKAVALTATINDFRASLKSNVPGITSLDSLEKEKEQLQILEASFRRSLHQTSMQQQYAHSSIVILEHAYPPEDPAFPIPFLNAIISLMLGLALGCYYALFLEYLSRLKQERIRRNMDRSPLREGVQHA